MCGGKFDTDEEILGVVSSRLYATASKYVGKGLRREDSLGEKGGGGFIVL